MCGFWVARKELYLNILHLKSRKKSFISSFHCSTVDGSFFSSTSFSIPPWKNKWKNHLRSLRSKNRYSFIIQNAREVTAKLYEWERETQVGKRPWCSSLGHSLALWYEQDTLSYTQAPQLWHACNIINIFRLTYFLTAIDVKMEKKKSSTIFIKFYNFVFFFFLKKKRILSMVVVLIVVANSISTLFERFSYSPLEPADLKEKKKLTIYWICAVCNL